MQYPILLLLMAAQVAQAPAPPSPLVPPPPQYLVPEQLAHCTIAVRDENKAGTTADTQLHIFSGGAVHMVLRAAEAEGESKRNWNDLLIQLDGQWYAEGRVRLFQNGPVDALAQPDLEKLVVIAIAPSFADALLQAKRLDLWEDRDKRKGFVLTQISETQRDELRDCLNNLPESAPEAISIGRPYLPQKPLQPATPLNKHNWVSSNDYPVRMFRAGYQGTVAFTAEVGVNGQVRNCWMTAHSTPTIIESVDDVPELNAATCRAVKRRGRFAPATDADGRPFVSNYSARVRWMFPER
jgi:hypothetical protein